MHKESITKIFPFLPTDVQTILAEQTTDSSLAHALLEADIPGSIFYRHPETNILCRTWHKIGILGPILTRTMKFKLKSALVVAPMSFQINSLF